MLHVDDGRLNAWLDRERSGMTPAEAAEIEAHVDECDVCAARLAEARSFRDGAAAILADAGAVRAEAPGFAARLEGLERRTGARSGRRSALAALWAASFAIAIGLGWLGRDLLAPERIAIRTESGARAPGSGSPADLERSETPIAAAEPGQRSRPSRPPTDPSIEAVANAGVEAIPEVALGPEEESPLAPPPAVDNQDLAGLRTGAGSETAAAAASRAAAPAAPAAGIDATTRPRPALAVRGRVVDENGDPIGSAQVSLPNGSRETVTRPDGTFLLPLDPEAGRDEAFPLTARRIGYASATVTVPPTAGDTAYADIALRTTALALSQVVVADTPSPAAEPLAAVAERGGAAAAATADAFSAQATEQDWSVVPREAAEERLGRRLPVIPGLEIVRIEASRASSPTVRAVQRTESGLHVMLTFTRADADAPVEADAIGVVSEVRGDLRVAISGPLAPDRLRELLLRIP